MKVLEIGFEGGSYTVHRKKSGHFRSAGSFNMFGDQATASGESQSLYEILKRMRSTLGDWWKLYPLHVDPYFHEYIAFKILTTPDIDSFIIDEWKRKGVPIPLPRIGTLQDMLWDGESPYCRMFGYRVLMKLNEMDFFECPVTGLQICKYNPIAVILKKRGNGMFRSETPEVNGAYFYPQSIESAPFFQPDKPFSDTDHLIKTITEEIEDDDQ